MPVKEVEEVQDREISAPLTRTFSIVTSETQCVVLSIFLMMEKVPVNGADISHVQQLSKTEFSLTSVSPWPGS
jgi:hypothetical protein